MDLNQLFQLSLWLKQQGRYHEAIVLARQILDLARPHLGQGDPNYATFLNWLATLYQDIGDHAAALPLLRQVMEIRRTALGENHSLFVRCLDNLAASYQEMGDYAAALPLLRQALEIRRTALGEDHPEYAACLGNLSSLYRGVGDYAAALPLLRQALEILGEGSPQYAACLHNLAVLYREMGDHAAALPLLRQALEIRRTALGENHPDYANVLDNLATLHQNMGDYAAALPLFRQALEIRRTALGEEHPDYAISLNNLAGLYGDMGDHAAALPLLRHALETRRAALGEGHPDSAITLHNMARFYIEMGDLDAALPLFSQALEIRRAALGENHPHYAESLHCLVLMGRAMGRYGAALPICRQMLEIHRAALGEGHPRYAADLQNLAMLHQEMGDHAAALPLLRQAGEITRTALGEEHPDYACYLRSLSTLYVATGRCSEALPLMEQAASVMDRMVGQILAIGSERQRIAYLNRVVGSLHGFLSLVLHHLSDSPAAVRAALDLVLRRKAIAAEAMGTQRDAVLGGKYPALEPRLRELAALRMLIARKILAGPGLEGLECHLQRLAEWNRQKEHLEADLARQIPEMNLEQKLGAADRRAVALNLPEDMALVEFVRFPVFDFEAVPARGESYWKPSRYVAFVLPGGAPDEAQMIDLGEAEPIDHMIADFRAGVIADSAAGYGRDMARRREEIPPTAACDAGSALRAALFDRLAPALGSRTRLLIAPDGDLSRLPFEVLPTADGRRLIDACQISYLSCGRDVLRFGTESIGQPGEPLVVADPDFDLETVIVHESAQSKAGFWSRLLGRGKKVTGPPRQPVAPLATIAVSAGRHSRDLHHDRSAYHFHRLPETRAEGQWVATRLGVSPWLEAAALEGRLKAACRSPRILHLATHGFFLPDQQTAFHDGGRDMRLDPIALPSEALGAGRLAGPMMENPMLRSGLALAGANSWLQGRNLPEEAQDGLLTAEDVTGLDLLATELVVLSACETGLGQVHVGEGVFGLRRAFVLAGAKTLVMSLWKVPDEPTRELMEDFYGHLLAGQGRAEALREAQLEMKAKYPEPFYWGAFICQGDPSPLGPVRPGIAGTGVATDLPTGG
jgi:tetratricopeptide (TPR) repeat protein